MNSKNLLLLALVSTTSMPTMAANICARYVKTPTVTVIVEPAKRTYHAVPIERLAAISEHGGAGAAPDSMTLGLTYNNQQMRMEVGYEVAQLPDGFCVSPQVRVTIFNRQVDVLLPKELPSTSCLYQSVLEHELKHVRIVEDVMAEELKKMGDQAQGQLNGTYGFFQRLQDAKPWLDQYRTSMTASFEHRVAQVNAASEAIDTPEEYRRVADQCKQLPKPLTFWEKLFGRISE